MKQKLINILKVILPLGIGVYLIWYFNSQMTPEDKTYLLDSFGEANYWWIALSLVCGFLGILSRAHRWKYLIDPMGYKISFWNAYHAIMIGYLVNYTVPRAGEASRAAMLQRFDGVPFNKSFGTIVAERAIDVLMLGIVCLIALGFEYANLDTIMDGFARAANSSGEEESSNLIKYIVYGIIGVIGLVGVIAYAVNKGVREKINSFIKGIIEGVLSVFRSKNPGGFTLHTLFIWIMYVVMFMVCFQALPQTQSMPFGGVLAGFIAGTLGLMFIPGGIGAYPVAVGVIVTIYLFPNHTEAVHGSALGIGYIIWASQTAMMILLGLLSLLIKFKQIAKKDNGSK